MYNNIPWKNLSKRGKASLQNGLGACHSRVQGRCPSLIKDSEGRSPLKLTTCCTYESM